jgi:hypothetical protein
MSDLQSVSPYVGQCDRTATRGVQAQDRADCTAVGGHGRHVVLGVTCLGQTNMRKVDG